MLRQSGEDKVCVVSGGVTLHECLKAADKLKAEGVQVRVVDMFCLSPVDREGLRANVKACGSKVLVVEEHFENGGVGDCVRNALTGEA